MLLRLLLTWKLIQLQGKNTMPNKTKQVETHSDDVDLTPMLDVVFIMLIFFIVTASFVKEQGLAINQPAPSTKSSPSESIVLEVSELNQVTIRNKPVSLRAIRPTIIRMLSENPDASVGVKLHGRAKTKTVISIIDALHSANVIHPPVSLVKS